MQHAKLETIAAVKRGSRGRSGMLAIGMLLCLPGYLCALPEDRDQPIYIQSDHAERDERTGMIVYTGDVEVDQGSLHISADRVTIRSENDEVDRIEANGSPARMQQKPAMDKETVFARAKLIRYEVEAEVLTLSGDASVTQEEARITGAEIVYFMREQRVKASASVSSGARSTETRVTTVLPPRRNKDEHPQQSAAQSGEAGETGGDGAATRQPPETGNAAPEQSAGEQRSDEESGATQQGEPADGSP